MLRVVGASVVAEVVQAADPVQLLGMSQPLQILRNLVVLGEALRERDVVWRAVEIERIVPAQLAVAGDRLERVDVIKITAERERVAADFRILVHRRIEIGLLETTIGRASGRARGCRYGEIW